MTLLLQTFNRQVSWKLFTTKYKALYLPLIDCQIYLNKMGVKLLCPRTSKYWAGFPPGGVRTPHSAPQGEISPPCGQEKLKYILYFTVISVKIGHFNHQYLKLNFFLRGGGGRTLRPPTPFGPASHTFPAETLLSIIYMWEITFKSKNLWRFEPLPHFFLHLTMGRNKASEASTILGMYSLRHFTPGECEFW